MKTKNLTIAQLNYIVGKLEALEMLDARNNLWELAWNLQADGSYYDPATNPTYALPIIEREGIECKFYENIVVAQIWYRDGIGSDEILSKGTGPTMLVAAMRCYVMHILGEEVDIPEGLF